MRIFRIGISLLLASATAVPLAARAVPSPNVEQEISYLLGYIANSGCEFYRNGSWSDARTAQSHVMVKYDWVKGRIATARDFIDMAASTSSFSGQPYQVRCGQTPPVTSNAWLNEALAHYQAQARR